VVALFFISPVPAEMESPRTDCSATDSRGFALPCLAMLPSENAKEGRVATCGEMLLLSGIVHASEVEHYGVESHGKACSAVLLQSLCV
jgi:hypothetical protein